MKRAINAVLALALLTGFVAVSSGCASSSGRYFQRTREHKAHVNEDRIYNPADYRYVAVDDN